MISYFKRSQDSLFVVIIILTSLFIYSPSIKIPLINDEIAFIQRNEISSLKDSPSLLEKKDYDDNYYRPIPDFISGLTTLVFKYNYCFYRILNICLHSISGVLIYYFLISLPFFNVRKKLIALFSALFFITFPLHDYAVIWHTDLFDRILLIFYIGGLIAFVKNNFKPGLPSLVLFSLALLSKEMAFSFPLIIGLMYFCSNKRDKSIKEAFFIMLPYLIISVLFILFRLVVFHNNIFTDKGAHSSGTFWDIIKNYILFSGLVIFPFSIREIQTIILAHQALAILSVFFAALIIIYFTWNKIKIGMPVVFFVLFWLLTVAPASRLLMRWYIYLPSVGFTSALAYCIFTMNFKKKITPISIALIILIVYSTALINKENIWIKISKESLTSLTKFIDINRNEILQKGNVVFLTVPAKIDDIPVFQLGYDKLFNFYFNDKKKIDVELLTKSSIRDFSDSVMVNVAGDRITMEQNGDNSFILFNNEKNVKFDNYHYKKGTVNALSIIYPEVKNKILCTFSNGKFYKIRGIE
jgi:hypothetical protein